MLITEAHNLIQTELGPREQLLWAGTPRKGFALRPSDTVMIPFSLVWGGLAFNAEYQLIRTSAELFQHLWNGMFVLFGIYLLVGRFIVDIWQRDRTTYGVTNERIIILTKGLSGQRLTSIDLRHCPEINLDQRNDGSGTIIFGPSNQPHNEEEGQAKIVHRSFRLSAMPKIKAKGADREYPSPAFEMITEAKNVYNLIREVQRGV